MSEKIMENDVLICFVILHYNTIKDTINCITSILTLDSKQCGRIVIVDNASPNQTGQILAEKYKENNNVAVLLREHNDGFSAGNNAGCSYAISRWNPAFLVVANNDVEFSQKDFIPKIIKKYEKNKFAILGPDIYSPVRDIHQSPISDYPPDQKTINKTIFLNQLALWLYPIVYPILKYYIPKKDANVKAEKYDFYQENVCLMGACMIYSQEYINSRNKIFEPETNFYYEEYIQTLWCLHFNKKIVYCPDIVVYHMGSKATNTIEGKKKIKFRIYNILQAAKIYRQSMKNISSFDFI